MRRLAILLLTALPGALLAAGCGEVPYSAKSNATEDPAIATEDPATANARKAAGNAGDKIYTARVWPARDLARRATDIDGVEVMRLQGTSTAGTGVVLVVRVSGTGPEPGLFPSTTVTVRSGPRSRHCVSTRRSAANS